ncbi:MAG: UDP-glucose 4-epimerase GalE [Anaerolinea sp.]|nr:UDP-glucose 4-epimerase GalE [Anaerolinea sp.]
MILVTGGAGYIGSHTCIELAQAGFQVVVLDNLSNSSRESIARISRLLGDSVEIRFELGDIRSRADLRRVFELYDISAVIHFAGLKAVGESVAQPLKYYENNVAGTITLCEAMAEAGCKTLVFSSSATVYGNPATVPIREDFPLAPTNPYGWSKLMIEQLLRDLHASDPAWSIGLLRYFNPVGAHPSGIIGEDPMGIPNNLMPFITQVAVGKRPKLSVFGNDYPTPDGTGVRDYLHVVDLAKGHVLALKALEQAKLLTVNLGTGRGYSVLEVVAAFDRASGVSIPYEIVPRRPGDIAACYADPGYAEEVLGWKAELNLERMCEDSWRWQSMNPCGYGQEICTGEEPDHRN